jgi:hypothetical protein
LKHEGPPAVKPAESTGAAPGDDTDVNDVAIAQAVAFVARAKLVLSAYPELWRNLARVPDLLDASASGGRGTVLFLIMLAGAIAVALGSEAVLRRSLDGLRHRLAAAVVGAKRFWPLLALADLDALGLACVLIVSYGGIGYWFPGSDVQSRLAGGILAGVFYWRLYMVVFRIFLRPGLPDARLVRLDDADARAVYFRLSILMASFVAIAIIVRILIAMKASPDAIAAGQVLNSFLILGLLLWASWQSWQALATWFTGMGGPTAAAGVKGVVAKHWLSLAVPFFIVLCSARIYGAIVQHPAAPLALRRTSELIVGLILFETLLDFITYRLAPPATAHSAHRQPGAADVVARCVRVAVVIAVGVLVAQTWIVDVLGLVDMDQWRSVMRSSLIAGGALFVAYVAWEIIRFVTDR